MRLAGCGHWTRNAARGTPCEQVCAGCRRRPPEHVVELDGEPVLLCWRCARIANVRPVERRPWLRVELHRERSRIRC